MRERCNVLFDAKRIGAHHEMHAGELVRLEDLHEVEQVGRHPVEKGRGGRAKPEEAAWKLATHSEFGRVAVPRPGGALNCP